MLKSYITIGVKHLLGHKLYSGINILGLAVGLAGCLLIGLFLRYELGFEDGFENADRIFRISRDYFATDGLRARKPASNNAPVAPALLEDFPEIEQAARLFGGRMLFTREGMSFYEDRFRWADASFFDIFDFEWLAGDPATALDRPGSLVLTETLATKYFGTEVPIGETLTLGGDTTMTVTGVIGDLPDNTHLSIDAVGSLSTLVPIVRPDFFGNWNSSTDFHTYFLMREGADVAAIERRIPQFMNRHIAEDASSWSGMTIMNIRDIHLRSNRDEEMKPPGSLATVYTFAAIALLILAIACINFMNLAAARSVKRAREVGVRKTLGATRGRLIVQFLAESVLTAAAAMFLAAVIVELLLPAFSGFLGAELRLDYFGPDGAAPLLAAGALIVGVAAGSYPAFYLSAFEPAGVLKGDVAGGVGGKLFRNALVVVQFSIAIALLIGTATVYQQWRFARNIDLGFNRDRIVVLSGSEPEGLGAPSQWRAMKEQLLSRAGVLAVTASHYTPFSFDDNQLPVRRPGASGFNRVQYMAVDYDFFETYQIDVLAGRSFSPDFAADALVSPTADAPHGRGAFIVNESAAAMLGLTAEAAIDQAIEIPLDEEFVVGVEGTIVGVVDDTYFESVHVEVRPLIFFLNPDLRGPHPLIDTASIRVAGAGLPQTLERIDAIWRELMPERPVVRHFLDEDFEALYRSERRQGQMFGAFSALAVFVACLGLFGLTAFTTERRTKEIGVRKAMGGSLLDIVRLFTVELSGLVVLANLIAWPIVYFPMQRWLSNFVYRIDMSAWVYVGSGVLAFLIAWATIGGVAARAANAKPIEALRHE